MNNKFHGVFSLILLALAIVAGLVSLWRHSFWLALVYLLVTGLAAGGILYAFCAKCLVRLDNCSHVFPGRLTRHLPRRRQEPYTFGDIGVTMILLAVILLFPQYWLVPDMRSLILFWLPALLAVTEILLFVCRTCENTSCLMCPRKDVITP